MAVRPFHPGDLALFCRMWAAVRLPLNEGPGEAGDISCRQLAGFVEEGHLGRPGYSRTFGGRTELLGLEELASSLRGAVFAQSDNFIRIFEIAEEAHPLGAIRLSKLTGFFEDLLPRTEISHLETDKHIRHGCIHSS